MPPISYSPDALRRRPDLEAPELLASDAADRLILDESAEERARQHAGAIVVIGDEYGALTLGAADAGAADLRVHQDSLAGEQALAANADGSGLEARFRSMPLDAALVAAARVVLLRLPRALDALDDVAGLIAAHAHHDVVVFAGGRIKHMTTAMNDVLRRYFDTVDVTHARQKSRVLIARGPHDGRDPVAHAADQRVPGWDAPLAVRAFGGAFAGTGIDIGTRFLLEQLAAHGPAEIDPAAGDVIDFACGTGVVASWFALRHPTLPIVATDRSAIAAASTRETVAANDVADRVRIVRDLGLSTRADASAQLLVLNPPFHSGAAVPISGVAAPLFADAGRVLAPGGELWVVWNTALQYRGTLERFVGPTRQIGRNAKFTVTVSTAR